MARVTVMKFRIMVAMEKIHLFLGLLKAMKLALCTPTLGDERGFLCVCLFGWLVWLWFLCHLHIYGKTTNP